MKWYTKENIKEALLRHQHDLIIVALCLAAIFVTLKVIGPPRTDVVLDHLAEKGKPTHARVQEKSK